MNNEATSLIVWFMLCPSGTTEIEIAVPEKSKSSTLK